MKTNRSISVLIGSVCFALSCGGDTAPPTSMDMATNTADMTFLSGCGHPGDTEVNSKGVGRFCATQNDCPTTNPKTAVLCSADFNDKKHPSAGDSYICTTSCTGPDDKVTCGDNAICVTMTSTGGVSGNGCVPAVCKK